MRPPSSAAVVRVNQPLPPGTVYKTRTANLALDAKESGIGGKGSAATELNSYSLVHVLFGGR